MGYTARFILHQALYAGVSDSHQIQDLASLLKETSSSVDEDGLYCQAHQYNNNNFFNNNREGIKSISKAADNIISGQSMAIFPEGDLTWVKDPNVLVSEFRNGALKIAYKAKCPIVPIVIKNSRSTYDGYQPVGKIHSVPVEVEFLEPIYDHIQNPKLKSTVLSNDIKEKMIDSINYYLNKKAE